MRKRSKLITRRQMSDATKPAGNSKYSKKVAARNQMYGPGCCAHGIDAQATLRRIAERRRQEFVSGVEAVS